jgi:FAD/FMN-containing dehydrogenase
MTQIGINDLEILRSRVTGVVAEAGSAGYNDSVAIWNGAIDRHPSVVVRCASNGDVASALRFARDHGLDADRQWVRDYWSALVPHAAGVGSYVNFMSEYEEDRVRAAYGPAKYDRLAEIKREYDPENVFHLNANIVPARR